jgi:arylsulfatase A-like enzyme
MHNLLPKLILTAVLSFHFSHGAFAADPSRPNILFIVADDMGYADCGVHGSKDIPTPNIDSIAKAGVRFTDGYVTGPVCSPTRAALMTARYQHRDGVPDWVKKGSEKGLNPGVPTIADYLRQAGYRTALIGKWHLGEKEPFHPLNRGFDEFFGLLGGGRLYYQGLNERNGGGTDEYARLRRGREPVNEDEYVTTAFGREAVQFIERQQTSRQPFFLFLSFTCPHTPLMAPKGGGANFSSITDPQRRTYATMMAAMDDAIGRVLAAVRKSGIQDNTLICFISDNGGPITRNSPNGSTNTPLRGGKGETWEGGIRVPFLMSWPGHLPAGGVYRNPVIQMDLAATALALAGTKADPKWPIDGVNLMPFLTGGNGGNPHEALCWAYENAGAIRQGDWKLVPVAKGAKAMKTGLYDLSKDISESHDLSDTKPELVEQLKERWGAWMKDVSGDTAGDRTAIPGAGGKGDAE